MKAKVVLAGHSHVHALGVPGWPAGEKPGLVPIKHSTADVVAIVGNRDAAYWDLFVESASNRVPAVIWAGNQHYAHFLFRPAVPLDFILSAEPRLPLNRAAQIVPEEMIRTFLDTSLTPLSRLLGRLAKRSPFPPIVIGTPPPKGDLERLCANIRRESVLHDIATKLGVPIAPSSLADLNLIVKLWRLIQTILAEIARETGAVFVPVPQQLITGEGVLHDEFWASDATHANRAYGSKMLAAVLRQAELGVTTKPRASA
ncbi:SGNH/GDSL hydrolase family protein [Sphingomonas radiodurans]|uniref:SGNH/GDSL hydrolase family protein n=1 Tax=Sphingomonas radiodurans TaxID=2890321 RepID=UPI001E61FCDB|nr:SGNH/GDSL hydrolase family protein [Sphingomonas radiodurans]WBH16397.1 SGNH/GDSL hydrolase family protein [Sphingomonas radiodurans]